MDGGRERGMDGQGTAYFLIHIKSIYHDFYKI